MRTRSPQSILAALLLVPLASLAAETPSPEDLEFFENKIRPVLATNCYVCHSAEAKTRMGGLSLDTRDGIREGGQRGHAVVPSDPAESLLLAAIRYQGDLKMPPEGKLSEDVVANFETWIKMGAPDPRESSARVAETTIDLSLGREYWAFQAPVKRPPAPVKDLAWPRGMIDQYVLAGLESRGLRPVADAGKPDLLRRVTIDLTGLLPSVEELEAFLADDSERALANVVDRLLDSERYGERWGRHWLDVVRYADTIGRTRNLPFPMAWRYRDYVIRAFNRDKPYDRFLVEQLAGDLLPHSSGDERRENQVATGFLALGAHDLNEPDAKQFEMDIADEMINVTTRSVLALSVGCARCHDHKFDPIPAKDYYAMAGIFHSAELRNGLRRRPRFNAGYFQIERMVELDGVPAFVSAEGAAQQAERERLWQELRAAEERADRTACRSLVRELAKVPLPGNLAMGVVEAAKPANVRLNIGGDPHTLDKEVPRGFVQVLFAESAQLPEIGDGESGRLQLAQWLTRPDNPLTARVMANRVWRHLFGQGLVATVDNFGSSGRQPTNQALLDYLAVRFVEGGWSVKALVREIALSRAYRLSTRSDPANFEVDPDNDHLWRANIRRLEAESVRDSVLLVSGELRDDAGRAPAEDFDPFRLINPGDRRIRPWELNERYRSVFVPVIRNLARPMFETFDFPEPSETKGSRDVTTGPAQALFLMNSEFVRSNALVAAERLMAGRHSDRERVRHAFQQVLGRAPSAGEADRTLRHVEAIASGLASPEAAAEEHQRGRDWLAELLEASIGRAPGEAEIDSAVETLGAGGNGSVSSMQRAFLGEDGCLRRGPVQAASEAALGRPLTDDERAAARKRLRACAGRERGDTTASDGSVVGASASPRHEAWARVYHALFNSAEFRYRN